VKDFGRGIPKQDFERIFKPFQQASLTVPDDVCGGTGLGLAITHRLVSAMGGRISVDSEIGKWSEFTVDLPCCDPPPDIVAIQREMQNCTVIIVGIVDGEGDHVGDIFLSYGIEYVMFATMQEMKTAFLDENRVSRDRTYVCLFQEDAFHENSEPYQMLSKLAKATYVVFGDEYRGESAHHIRSTERIIPSVLIERLCETTRDVSEGGHIVPKTGVAYRKIRVLIAEDNKINQKVLQRMLVRLGLQHIDIVDDGKQAVEKEAVTEYGELFWLYFSDMLASSEPQTYIHPLSIVFFRLPDIVLMDQQVCFLRSLDSSLNLCSVSNQSVFSDARHGGSRGLRANCQSRWRSPKTENRVCHGPRIARF